MTGDVDITTSAGRLTARMLGGLARYESDHKSERIRRKHLEIAAERPRLGWRLAPLQLRGRQGDRAACGGGHRGRVCAAALAREPVRSIAQDLNERGIPAATGGAVVAAELAPDAGLATDKRPARPPRRDRAHREMAGHHQRRRRSQDPRPAGEPGAADEQGSAPLLARRAARLRPLRREAGGPTADGRQAPLRLRQGRRLLRLRQDLHQRRRGGTVRHPGGAAPGGLARLAAQRRSDDARRPRRRTVAGGKPKQTRQQLEELAADYGQPRDHDGESRQPASRSSSG